MTGALLVAVPLLPLLAAVVALATGRRLPRLGGMLLVASLAGSLAALLTLHAGARLSAEWFAVGRFRLIVGLEATGLTWFAGVVVAAIALAVSLYAVGYMREEPTDQSRFFAGMGLFAGAMLALVLASSFVLLFAGWELVGLASYLLIGFRTHEDRAVAAASRAFLMTRLGDMGLLLGWLLALLATGTTDIGPVLDAARSGGHWAPGFPTLLGCLMFAGAVGKSAQLPLSAWLPDAMAGPTPVSALLHSATMVAAGVFLLLRLFPLFQAAPGTLALVFWTGAATAIFAGLAATAEMDLKRVLAWSTSAQLAEMMVAVGLGVPYAAALHFATHAAFKATLFTAAGSVERRAGTRDLGRLGGLARVMPLTAAVFAAGALSLAGVPPLAGFWSEEAILSAAAGGTGPLLLIVAVSLLSGIYIGRAGVAAFGGRARGEERAGPPQGGTMRVAMVALAAAAVGVGWLLEGPALARLLGMGEPRQAALAWRGLAVAAALAGLAYGGGRAWSGGGAPALGNFPRSLAAGLDVATRAIAETVMRAAAWLDAIERVLDRGARAVSDATWTLAQGAEWAEARGFGQGGDQLAVMLGDGGQHLRTLQSGKLYLYTLGLFVWAAGVLAAALVLLLR